MARLRRSRPLDPGLRRIRHGRGFRYADSTGRAVDADTKRRIKDLVIPPAWEDVWICPWPNGHIQATGADDAGRRQYLYHPQWRTRRDRIKHDHALEFARRLPKVRQVVEDGLDAEGLGRERVLCAAVALLDIGVFRIGGIIQVGPVKALTEKDFENAWQTMFAGPMRLTLAVLPLMRARRSGTIVTIASVGGRVPVPHLLPYVAAKHALAAFSSALRAEVIADGVSVTTVVPGLMRTGSHRAARFSGNAAGEFGWFSVLSALPLMSGSADRAARAIVRAAERRRPELVFTPAANNELSDGATILMIEWQLPGQ